MSMAGIVRHELQRIDPALPVLRVDTIDEQLDDVLAPERLTAALVTAFGSIATLMACLGLYGVISYIVGRRTNEIGVRMALGATRAGIFRTVLAESALLVFAGLAIGVLAALAVARLLSSRLVGVAANDPVTFAVAALLTIVVAIFAAVIPAHRASTVDPMIALRCD
jgi:ABC-type antimicrobial peptide transport system permease subunit